MFLTAWFAFDLFANLRFHRRASPSGRIGRVICKTLAGMWRRSGFLKPFVSILIPAYNAQEWISETLRSAIAQTWGNREIIVVDDGSTDATLAVARRFESLGVQVFSQPNQGAAAARNTAFSLCRGDYIQWLDADDLLSPDKITSQIAALQPEQGRAVVLSCPWGRFRRNPRRAVFVATDLWRDLSPGEWLMRQMEESLYMQTATWLVSRELTEAAGPWDTRLLGDDDGEYFARVLLASDGTKFVPQGKVYYRMSGPGSLSHIGTSDKKRDAQWLSMRLHVEYLRRLDDGPRARTACIKYLQNWIPFFYPERLDIVEKAAQLARELDGSLHAPFVFDPPSAEFSVAAGPPQTVHPLNPTLRWSLHPSFNEAISLERRKSRFSPPDGRED